MSPSDRKRCPRVVRPTGTSPRAAVDAPIKQADDRYQRPHPAQGCSRKAHRFRPRQFGDRAAQQFRQDLGGGAARALDDCEIELAAAGIAHLALRDRGKAGGAQETVDRLLRCADPGAAALFIALGLARGNTVGDDREAARRHEAAQARGRRSGWPRACRGSGRRGRRSHGAAARRDFLRQEFEDNSPASRCPIGASMISRADFMTARCDRKTRRPGEGRDPRLARTGLRRYDGEGGAGHACAPVSQASQQARARARTRPI